MTSPLFFLSATFTGSNSFLSKLCLYFVFIFLLSATVSQINTVGNNYITVRMLHSLGISFAKQISPSPFNPASFRFSGRGQRRTDPWPECALNDPSQFWAEFTLFSESLGACSSPSLLLPARCFSTFPPEYPMKRFTAFQGFFSP